MKWLVEILDEDGEESVKVMESPDFSALHSDNPTVTFATILPRGPQMTALQAAMRDEWAQHKCRTVKQRVVDPHTGEVLAEPGGWKENHRLYDYLMHFGPADIPAWLIGQLP